MCLYPLYIPLLDNAHLTFNTRISPLYDTQKSRASILKGKQKEVT